MGRLLPGIYPAYVPENPKCRSCLHYNMERSLCEVALHPTTCGDGSTPEQGYHPLVNTGPGSITDGHTQGGRAPEVDNGLENIDMLVTHLGDPSELLALSQRTANDLKKSRNGSIMVQPVGQTSIASGLHTGNRLPSLITAYDVAERMYKSLGPLAQTRCTVELLEAYVKDQGIV